MLHHVTVPPMQPTQVPEYTRRSPAKIGGQPYIAAYRFRLLISLIKLGYIFRDLHPPHFSRFPLPPGKPRSWPTDLRAWQGCT